MRIISQDGMQDVPYECSRFSVVTQMGMDGKYNPKKNLIRAYITGDAGMVNMAEYSTLEKSSTDLIQVIEDFVINFHRKMIKNLSSVHFNYFVALNRQKEV